MQRTGSVPERSWGAPMDEGIPETVAIIRVKKETPQIRTFFFDKTFTFSPGQFVMVWVPGVDEIPMALSSPNSITVQKVGDATAALFQLKPKNKSASAARSGTGLPEVRRFLRLPEVSVPPPSSPSRGPTAS